MRPCRRRDRDDRHYRSCGRCRHCRGGWAQMCLRDRVTYGVTGDGGHADAMRVQLFDTQTTGKGVFLLE